MSHSGWTTGAAQPPEEGEGVLSPEARPDAPPDDGPAHAYATNFVEPGGPPDDPHNTAAAEDATAPPTSGFRLRRETRFGLATLLSFLVLAAVLVANKNRGKTNGKGEAGKPAPVTQIGGGRGTPPVVPPPTPADPLPALPVPARDAAPVVARVAPHGAGAGASATPVAAPSPAPVDPDLLAMAGESVPLPPPAREPAAKDDKDKPSPPVPDPAPAPEGSEKTKADEPAAPAPAPAGEKPEPLTEPTLPPPTGADPAPGTPAPKDQAEVPPKAQTEPTPKPEPPATEPPKAEAAEAPKAEAPAPQAERPEPSAKPGPAPAPESPRPTQEPAPAGDPNRDLLAPAAPVADPMPAPAQEPPAQTAPAEAVKPAPAEPPPAAAAPPGGEPLTLPDPPATQVSEPAPAPAPAPVSPPKATGNPAPLPNLDHASEPAPEPAKSRAASMGPGTWVALPNAGKVQNLDDDDRISPEPAASGREPRTSAAADTTHSGRTAAGRDRVEPVPHVVQSLENFWTISRLYYGSGRFYKALWAANKGQVAAPELLRVNQTIVIPPPEDLDRSLIDPERTARGGSTKVAERLRPSPTSGSTVRKASRAAASGDGVQRQAGAIEVELPTSDPFARRGAGDDEPDVEPAPPEQPRRPRYKVRSYETLRSIARDTLGDSRRADEILDLNAEVIDDPTRLISGQILELPEDAKILTGRRKR